MDTVLVRILRAFADTERSYQPGTTVAIAPGMAGIWAATGLVELVDPDEGSTPTETDQETGPTEDSAESGPSRKKGK